MTVRLRPYALITYAVPAERLGPRLPAELELCTISFADGTMKALVSLLVGRAEWIRAVGQPIPSGLLQYGQVNVRTYVSCRGQQGVFFFRSFLGSRLVARAAQLFSGFPAQHAEIRLEFRSDQRESHHLHLGVSDHLEVTLASDSNAPERFEGFPSSTAAIHFLTHPLIGYFRKPDGAIGALGTSHQLLLPTAGRMIQARMPWMMRQGLLEESQVEHPHSILIVPSADFDFFPV